MAVNKNQPLKADDVMSRSVIAIGEDEDVWSATKTLVSNGITGAPVINVAGQLVGVISQTDIVRYLREATAKMADFYSEAEPDGRPLGNGRVVRVRDLMTRRVIQACESDSLKKIKRMMLRERVHRVIITRAGRLVGIVTTMDALREA